MKKTLLDYYGEWEGHYCLIHNCDEIVPNDTGDMYNHLRDKHKIRVKE